MGSLRISPIVIVLDTNVLLALWVFEDPEVALVRDGLEQGRLLAMRSAETDAEFREVLARPRLLELAAERREAAWQAWDRLAAPPTAAAAAAPWRCRDPLDQKFLDLAVGTGARWLLTRDKDLLKVARRCRRAGAALEILTPAEFARGYASFITPR